MAGAAPVAELHLGGEVDSTSVNCQTQPTPPTYPYSFSSIRWLYIDSAKLRSFNRKTGHDPAMRLPSCLYSTIPERHYSS